MLLEMFSIYDSKVGAYMTPQFLHSIGQATRWFSDILKDESSPIAKHPEDYTLFHLGSYEDTNALFTPLPTPHSLGVGLELL